MGFGSPNNSSPEEPYSYGYPTEPRYVILPPAPHNRRRHCRVIGYVALALVLFLAACALVYLLWPSNPEIQVVRLKLNHIRVKTKKSGSILPHVFVDISLGLTVKVKNKDHFGIGYKHVKVGIVYRGEKIGSVWSQSGYVPPRRTAYVDATLDINGIEVLNDVFHILADIARRQLPLRTVTEIEGRIRVLSVNVPLKTITFAIELGQIESGPAKRFS
eukprot:Gb_10353 [translate_table: standard]